MQNPQKKEDPFVPIHKKHHIQDLSSTTLNPEAEQQRSASVT